MRLHHFSFLFLILFGVSSWAIKPQDLCDPAGIEELRPSERARMEEVCSYAGQYEESMLPDQNATASKKFRDGKSTTYDYKDFFSSFTRSLNAVNRPERCDPNKEGAPRVAYPTINLEKTAAGTIPISVVKEEELNQIFAEIARDPKYAFGSVENGCWARAHIMARELEKRGIRVGKMFAEGTLAVRTEKALNGEGVVWTYHVAPLVAVETTKGTELRVLDPSMFDKPVPVKTWTDKMLPDQELKDEVELYVTDRFVLEPLRGNRVTSIKEDPSRGRWHMAETIMAEQELEQRRLDLEDRDMQREFLRKMKQKAEGVSL